MFNKIRALWLKLSLEIRVAIFGLLGLLAVTVFKPETGRYHIIDSSPNSSDFDVFDTAKGKLYQWRGTTGVITILDPVTNTYTVVGSKDNKTVMKGF